MNPPFSLPCGWRLFGRLLIVPGSRCIWIRADPVLIQLRLLTVIQRQTAMWCESIFEERGLGVGDEDWDGLHFPGCHLTRKKQAKLTSRDQGTREVTSDSGEMTSWLRTLNHATSHAVWKSNQRMTYAWQLFQSFVAISWPGDPF